MKNLILAVFLLAGCATVGQGGYEAEQCPAVMTPAQKESGVVRCRAMCSSYARDFSSFDDDCKCRCKPAVGGGYRPQEQFKVKQKSFSNET